MEAVLFKYQLKPNSLKKAQAWVQYFNTNREEILRLLESEGIWVEAAFWESVESIDYMYYFVKADNLKHAQEVFLASPSPHDDFHRRFMRDVVESATRLEVLIDMDRIIAQNKTKGGPNK